MMLAEMLLQVILTNVSLIGTLRTTDERPHSGFATNYVYLFEACFVGVPGSLGAFWFGCFGGR